MNIKYRYGRKSRCFIFSRTFLLVFSAFWIGATQASPLPKLQANGSIKQLWVDGKPFIVLGGELHNSSASSVAYMEPLWQHFEDLNLNTVLLPVYWELVEPNEGSFDLSLVDDFIHSAGKHNLKLIFLWFGALKNARSTYAPSWVLADRERFPRAEIRPSDMVFSRGSAPISIFGDEIVKADARAFGRFMGHLKKNDPQHTVIAVQVENEAGLLGDSRDRSAIADVFWEAPVPEYLMQYLKENRKYLAPSLEKIWQRSGYKQSGSWAEVFGSDRQSEELFMAWGVGSFVNKVAAAGKEILDIPLYANAWIGPQNADDHPGMYPSGGPVPRVFDVWRAGAPALDWVSPDIYVEDFNYWAEAYTFLDNPLFVPEAHFIVGNLFEALGNFRAMGFSPFGVEDGIAGNQLSTIYGLLAGMQQIIADAQTKEKITGVVLEPKDSRDLVFDDYRIKARVQNEVRRRFLLDLGVTLNEQEPILEPQTRGDVMVRMTDVRAIGLIIQLAPDEFLVVGKNIHLDFESKRNPEQYVEYERVEEGNYIDGKWVPGRLLNGDERNSIFPDNDFRAVKIKLLQYR